jgi:hypothetical protein
MAPGAFIPAPKQGGTYVYCEYKGREGHKYFFCNWRGKGRKRLAKYRHHWLKFHS